jgi:hypothetical protein
LLGFWVCWVRQFSQELCRLPAAQRGSNATMVQDLNVATLSFSNAKPKILLLFRFVGRHGAVACYVRPSASSSRAPPAGRRPVQRLVISLAEWDFMKIFFGTPGAHKAVQKPGFCLL